MATLKDLLKSREEEIYGISGTALIESKGLVNIPRQAALLASSPNAIADLIGNQIGGALGGSAKRPSDTIFKDNLPFTKPVSVVPTLSQLRGAVEPDESYFIKKSPAPGSIFAKLKQGGTSATGMLQSAAIGAINQFGSKSGKNKFNNYIDSLKDQGTYDDYGTQYQQSESGKVLSEDKKFSTHYRNSETGKLTPRKSTSVKNNISNWDYINSEVLNSLAKTEDFTSENVKKFETETNSLNQTYVLIKLYGNESQAKNRNIILPGTISGISEDFAPEINSFKYVGSPFNVYRYGGVERTLKFNLKMYYLDNNTKISMKRNLDKLRQLVFPDKNIGAITYNNSEYSPLFFTPNLIYLTINGLYKNLLGIVDTLSITIDDNTPWATTDFEKTETSKETPYPTVFDVSFGMKIIEHPGIVQSNNQRMYNYGLSEDDGNQYDNYFTGIKNA